ncbi:MAG: orotidine-5'-phosphate decarboxylase [Oscillospiraceae bacterium]
MGKDVIIACDFPGRAETIAFLDNFTEVKPFLKIGMELFYAAGPDIVREIKARGHKVFLDLKLHDIPNTVESAMSVLSGLGADMTNVHASGAIPMMEAAMRGFSKGGENPILIAVTQLTSTSEERMRSDLLIEHTMEETVMHYAENAKAAGLSGVVCSPLEVQKVHETCGDDFLTVTPGIRFADNTAGDQARIATPALAKKFGSDYIVVGRPITRAADPVAAYRRCCAEFIG